MKIRAIVVPAMLVMDLASAAWAAQPEENAQDFMQMHKTEIAFHQAATNKNLDLMLSHFTETPRSPLGGKTYRGKEQIKAFWQSATTFQPQNQ
jgi:hypothetical protein